MATGVHMSVHDRAKRPRTLRWAVLGGALTYLWIAILAPSAEASGPPVVSATWSSQISTGSAKINAAIDPNGSITSYRFEYTSADFTNCGLAANPACHTFQGTLPASGAPPSVSASLFSLTPATPYSYRVIAQNSDPAGPQTSPTHTFVTWSAAAQGLLDHRGWEMVSPVDKNGGQVEPAGAIAGGGVLQGAADGNSATYGSAASFAAGAGGAPPASQYLATRSPSGWSTQNISTPPIFSGSYDTVDGGVPYQLFSPDLSSALLLNGDHCRGGASGCAVANPPLAGTDAPEGYQDYYLRDDSSGSFTALLGAADVASLDLGPADFDLAFAGASPDLRHVVLSSCAALTADANEVAASGSGCDPAEQNLYQWSQGTGLAPAAINGGTPGASLAAQSGAVSTNGTRVYWTDTATGNLYLHDSAGNHLIDTAAAFQTATPDGATAFYTKSGGLYSYDAATHSSSAALASGVVGVLGISASGDTVYFQDASGLQRRHSGTTTQIAADVGASAAAAPSDYPPATGTARVSSGGAQLLFESKAPLTGYDNTDLVSAQPDPEVFLYDASASPALACLSCNPTGERPLGPSTIPGAIANGTAPGSTDAYKPRALAADGRRAFFDSRDALVLADTNTIHSSGAGVADVYEWETGGEGSCTAAGGCLALISSGRDASDSSFVDASADGSDAFFLTDASLVKSYDSEGVLGDADPGALDLYDARVNGGFALTPPPIPCEGDACTPLPSSPTDPTLTTLLSGHGNPAVKYHNLNKKKKAKRCKRGFVKRGKRCVRKHKRKHKRHAKRHHKRGGRR